MIETLAAHGIPANLKCYVCIEVFLGERPILFVSRADGDWCFLCGGAHPDDVAYYRVVGIGHPMGSDHTLVDVLDLAEDEEAEREFVGAPWERRSISDDA